MTAVTTDRKAEVTFPADDQILISRQFDAPARLVWTAFTTPEHVCKWWHADRGEMTVAEIDLRVGGRWRYAMTTPEGYEVAFHGEYLEVVPNERLVSTEHFEGAPEGSPPSVNVMTLREDGGRTRLEILVQCDSQEQREAIIASGMEDGLQDALALLERTAVSAERG